MSAKMEMEQASVVMASLVETVNFSLSLMVVASI